MTLAVKVEINPDTINAINHEPKSDGSLEKHMAWTLGVVIL